MQLSFGITGGGGGVVHSMDGDLRSASSQDLCLILL